MTPLHRRQDNSCNTLVEAGHRQSETEGQGEGQVIQAAEIHVQVKDAASQLEFLKEVGSAGVGSLQAPDLLYLQGLLAWKQGHDLAQVAAHTLATAICAS